MALSKIIPESINLASDFAGMGFGGTGAANQLDDYEEGGFTPTFVNLGTGTYTVNSGRYTKVGNVVHIQIHMDVASLGSASGVMQVTGLPFTSRNDTVQYAAISAIHGGSWSVASSNMNGLVPPNTAYVDFYKNGGSSSQVQISQTDMGTGNLLFNVTYRTDA